MIRLKICQFNTSNSKKYFMTFFRAKVKFFLNRFLTPVPANKRQNYHCPAIAVMETILPFDAPKNSDALPQLTEISTNPILPTITSKDCGSTSRHTDRKSRNL